LNVRSALVGGDYGPGSGTSIATPHVTGVVALLLSARPDLIGEVTAVEQIIKTSALPRTSTQDCGGYPGDEVPNPIYGWGRVDALEALLGDADSDGSDNLTDCRPAAPEV
jgi:subtilisin family serine protease